MPQRRNKNSSVNLLVAGSLPQKPAPSGHKFLITNGLSVNASVATLVCAWQSLIISKTFAHEIPNAACATANDQLPLHVSNILAPALSEDFSKTGRHTACSGCWLVRDYRTHGKLPVIAFFSILQKTVLNPTCQEARLISN